MTSKIPKNSTPYENRELEIMTTGVFTKNEMRIMLFIKRNTNGYATKNGRRYWTRKLTHKEIGQFIEMKRSTVTTTIKELKKRNVIKQSSKEYRIDHNEEWNMSRNSTVSNHDKSGIDSQQKKSQNSTKNVEFRNTGRVFKPVPPSTSSLHKENSKEKNKENLKESELVDFDIKELKKLIFIYKERYRCHFKEDYSEWFGENKDRDLHLLHQVCKIVDKSSQWQNCSENLYDHVGMVIDLYFNKHTRKAKKIGIIGLTMTAKDLSQIIIAECSQEKVLSKV
jgi:hypothetical protein